MTSRRPVNCNTKRVGPKAVSIRRNLAAGHLRNWCLAILARTSCPSWKMGDTSLVALTASMVVPMPLSRQHPSCRRRFYSETCATGAALRLYLA
jgi:hypothetical protein